MSCSSKAPPFTPTPAISATTPNPDHVEQIVHAKIDFRVSGARSLDLKDVDAVLRIVEIVGDANPQIVHFFSVSSGAPVKLDDKHFLAFDADLAPGIYSGPGVYQLKPDAAVVQGQQTSLASAAYAQFIDLLPAPTGPKFDTLADPCTLVVGEHAYTGSVTCSKLSSASGGEVSLAWRWRRT